MKQALQEIITTPGVMGGYELHAKQGIGSHLLPESISKTILPDVSRHLLKIFAASRMTIKSIKDLNLHYEGLVLYLRHVTEQLFLVAICDATVNTKVVSMSVSLALEDVDLQAEAQKNEVPATRQATEPAVKVPALTVASIRSASPLAADLNNIEEAVARQMGPMAEMIIEDALEEWIQTVNASYENLPVLFKILCREIGDSEKIATFKAELGNYGLS